MSVLTPQIYNNSIENTVKVEQIDALDLTHYKALQIADLVLGAFKGDPLFSYWFGEKYRYGNPQLLKVYADCLVAYALDGMLFFSLTETASGRLVGISMWVPPESMLNVIEADSLHHQRSLKWKYRKTAIRTSLGLSYIWNWGIPNLARTILGRACIDHPLYNDRLAHFYAGFNRVADKVAGRKRSKHDQKNHNCEEVLAKLSGLSYQQLASTPYRKKDMYYLSVLAINPEDQKKGLGTVFLKQTLNKLSKEPIQFHWKDNNSVGPQKVYVNSSDTACALYRKAGFVESCNYKVCLEGYNISVTRLEKVIGAKAPVSLSSITEQEDEC